MKENDSDPRPQPRDSWANETLPMGLRRELLDRELRRLHERKARGQAGGSDRPGAETAQGDGRAAQ